MKYIYRLIFLITFATACSQSQIPQYKVAMTSADFESLYTRSIWSDVRLPAPFTSNDTTWPESNIRFKGHSTRYYAKKAYRVRFATSNLFFGLRDINLNSMYTDKSFLREKLSWDLFSDINAVAPFCYHSIFKINNETKGLFAFIDKIDRYFLINRGFTVGNLYEADDTYAQGDLTIQTDSLLKLYYSKEIGTANDYEDLKQLIFTLNTTDSSAFASTVVDLFDTNSVLNWFVVNSLTMMGDSYNKNYSLFHDTTRANQKWIIIPWDYDLSWGRDGSTLKPYPSSLLNDGFVYTYPPLSGPSNLLKDRWLSRPILKEKFRLKLKFVLDNIFTETRMNRRIDSLASLITNEVISDPQKWGTIQDFYEHVKALKYYVTVRRNFLYKTFINPPAGLYNIATTKITQTDVPYHFITYDGRTIATMWFHSFSGLDSVTIRAYPDSTPPFVTNPSSEKLIKRWLVITPHPTTATYSAKIQFMYNNYPSDRRELGIGVQNERMLRAHFYNGSYWESLPSGINSFANFVTIDNLNQDHTGNDKYISALMSETYTQKWFRQPTFFWQRFYDVKFTDQQNGCILGEHGTFLITSNGGVDWNGRQIGMNTHFFKFASPQINTLFAVGEFGTLFKSIDNGNFWTKIHTSTTRNLRSIFFSLNQNGWIAGDKGLVLTTTDNGNIWTPQVVDSTTNFSGIAAFTDNRVIVVGSKGSIFTANPGGGSFQSQNSSVASNLNEIKIYNDAVVWIVGDNGTVLTSTNRGLDWINKSIPLSTKLNTLHILNDNSLYVAGENGNIYFSNDRGDNWYSQYTADAHDIFAIHFVDPAYGIAVGNDATILKTTETGTITSEKQYLIAKPTNFRLYQNYPNPFNPTTIIEYDLPVQSKVLIRIFNILGQEVATLVDEFQKPGKYKQHFNGKNLSSGVYFYRLEVGNNYVSTKKFILMK